MPENTRVKISSVVKNQLPDFIKADFPLAGDFLAQYYTALEGQGSTLDILQNIDKYVKVDELTDLIDSTSLSTNVGIADNTITVDSTTGFPESYGLIRINSEVITYTGVTTNTFTGCSRGFSGITSFRDPTTPDELVFTNSGISTHSSGTTVNNLSILFLQEFFNKVKKQINPGFEERGLSTDINKRLFSKQVKDFYSSKGTDQSFEILFRALYGKDVNVIKPRDFIFIPSDSQYKVSKQIVVEALEGDPEKLINRNLFQDNVDGFPQAISAISGVEKIVRNKKPYYRLSLDYQPGSSRVTGDFSIHPNTKLVDSISIGSTVMSVDSTVGFGTTGSLLANFDDGTSNIINYTSKSLTQFFGCSGIDRNIASAQDIAINSYAYGYSGIGTADKIKVRVTGVLSNLDATFEDNKYSEIGDVIEPKGLGSNTENKIIKTLFSNISTTYDVESVELIDKSNFTYKLTLFDPHNFIVGDNALINDIECSIISLVSSKEVLIKGAGELSLTINYKIQRLISKANLSNYPSVNVYTTNIQNSYLDDSGNTYIASPSIPNYFNEALDIRETDILFSGNFDNSTEINIPNHGLLTGERVTYVAGVGDNKLDITESEYFVKKVDIDNIKIARSSANIANANYLSFSGNISNNKFELSEFNNKTIRSQNLIRKIQEPVKSTFSQSTQSGKTGILVNGVEILNYKSNDVVYYGPLDEVSVTNPGSQYDISNPPIFSVSDQTGIGVSAFCEVSGTIDKIEVVDGGFDYVSIPTLKITGGNGKGCIATPNLVLKNHSVEFDSIETAGLVNLTNNTIGFSTYHKFRDGELVSYNTEKQTAIAGLTTNATYYCCVKDATTVSLHKNYQDAIAGISSINITNYGAGIQELKCQSKKRVISSVSIGNSGSGYTNRLTAITAAGINTSLNTINIKGHGYKTGEKIRYDSKGTSIIGLATLTDYYVTEIGGDSFKLSAVGVGSTASNFYLNNKKYINLKDGGSGYHEFNYPPITVTVSGHIGVATFSGQNFNASLKSLGKGSIRSVYVVDGGSGYGSQDIINYNRQPEFTLKSGKNAQLYPIVSVEGKVTEVLVLNSGSEYNSSPKLEVSGEGVGCVVDPVLKGGYIDSIKVVHSGIGYTSSSTKIKVTSNGSKAEFYSNPKTWTINTFERLLQNDQITTDDGVVSKGLNSDYQLEYTHLYSPRKLRQSTYVRKAVGDKEVYVPDLSLENDIEQDSGTHSPILGWAYDGSPIYGSYGYSTNSGGSLKVLESGYSVAISSYRPNPLTSNGEQIYSNGFFVEDYVFQTDKDLDEHNGRFCKTPEYPEGVYAYFATINPNVKDSEGAFKNYRRPQFPYFIGNSFKYQPIEYNFSLTSNQDDIDLNKTDLVRNTRPYNFLFDNSSYDFLVNPNDINEQKTYVTDTSTGSIDEIGVTTGGTGYRTGDLVYFNNTGTSGNQAKGRVRLVEGKTINQISISNTTFSNVEFVPEPNTRRYVGYTTIPHNLYTQEFSIISGLSTNGIKNNVIQRVGIITERFKLFEEVSGISTTGIVTFFNIDGQVDTIKENDVLGIGTEKIKVLNVDNDLTRIRVIREYDSTVGSSHTSNSLISQNPRSLYFTPIGKNKSSNFRFNKELYFNPKESVALGNVSGVGIGSTLFFSNPGTGISEIFIPTKSIYFKNHGLQSGDTLTYRTNQGTALGVSTDGTMEFTLSNEQTLYAAPLSKDLIGIATARVGLGSTGSFVGINSTNANISTLYFTGIGTGLYHSLKTNYENVLSGKVETSLVTVSTASTHGLKANDNVILDILPGITTSIKVAYNDYNRRLVINPRSFAAADVSVSNNSITIARHGYKKGQKIIYTASTASGGLYINGIYYVYVVSPDSIKLCNEYYEATNSAPIVVNITSASAGTISPINPNIKIERDQKIEFDLSDSSLSFTNNEVSYSAFDFNLYSDSDLNSIFVTSGKTDDFNVVKSGRIGIDANAKLTVKNVEEIRRDLYYNLVPINDTLNSNVKKEIIRDTSNNINSNSLTWNINPLSGSHSLVGVGTTTFIFSSPISPEKLDYLSSDGKLTYSTNGNDAYGPIKSVNVESQGKGYKSLPGIATIFSDFGNEAILKPKSNKIGRISNVDIENIGFDYSADKTLKPQAQLPQLVEVDSLASILRIGITSVGTNYLNSPGLIVLDGLTKKVVPDIDLDYEIGDTRVSILNNTKNLNNVTPILIPTSNSNGITINNVDFNAGTKDVTITIGASFSDAADYPFEVGKKVMIEGVSVGVGSTGTGYNSENYEYTLFEIKATDPNIGGTLGTVRYSLSDVIPDGSVPGSFINAESAGKIIPESYFPIFDIKLIKNRFEIGETLISEDKKGILQSTNKLSGILKVSSPHTFIKGKSIIGESSKTKGTIIESTGYTSFYDIDSSSIVNEGWKTNSGFLNDDQQRIFDSDYYQYFSYSLQSEVQYEKWKEPVSSLNHTSGFKKFSDLIVNSESYAGIGTDQDETKFEVITDLISIMDLNTVYDFDLAREKTVEINSSVLSDEIVFDSKILADYSESVGNRVLTIDDISTEFNNNARTDAYMSVDSFNLASVRYRKYITFIRDKRYTKERQILLVSALHDNTGNIYLNQYGRVETNTDLGEFGGDLGSYDMDIAGDDGRLLFYPKKFSYNNYDVSNVAYNISDSVAGVGSTGLGGIVNIVSSTSTVPLGITTQHNIVSFATTYRGSKILVAYAASDSSYWEHDEITLVHDGTNVDLVEYGQITTEMLDDSGTPGLGTYSAYIAGSRVHLDLHPTVSTASTYVANTIHVDFGNASSAGVGTTSLNTCNLDSRYTAISASGSPSATTVAQYETETFNGAYYVVCVEDTTNSHYQISEVIVVDDGTTAYITEYAINQTVTNLGDFDAAISGDYTTLTFTPIASANVQVRVFQNALRLVDEANSVNLIDLENATIDTGFGAYTATETDVKRAFDLTHRQLPIFKRDFVGSATTTVSLTEDTIRLPDHYFVTGEQLSYRYTGAGTTSAIEIEEQAITGYGTTDKMPSTVYAVKVDDSTLRLATSAENALKTTPTYLDITAVGVGTSHSFTSTKQNSRCILSIDNVVQSPIVATAVTTTVTGDVSATADTIVISGITSITGGDLLKIGSEIMKVDSVGLGATNRLLVTRPWMGTEKDAYSANTLVTKVDGNYNIVDSTVNFFTAPVGLTPLSTTTNEPDERDWVGIATHSTFNGRSFMRSGITGSSDEPYAKNYIFDDISSNFTGLTTSFTLQSDGSNVAGFSTNNAVILINQVTQGPQRSSSAVSAPGDYVLVEDTDGVGITTIQFTGSISSVSYDPNTATVPLGGVIVSVGSTEGLGYQPLVAAGGTAFVSGLGTISSVSIGNSGSGYRVGVQTIVNVGVQTLSTGAPNIEFIGTAAISGGNIVSIAITNPGTGYTTTNPPAVVIDRPLSYTNIPLFYTASSAGVGSEARANIVVGMGGSVIDFEVIKEGYGYGEDQVLTIDVGGTVGIPTSSSFTPSRQFELTIQETISDSFAGWTVGDFQVLDPLDSLFNGKVTSFALNLNGVQQTIQSKPGSNIDVEVALLVFINDILQVPDVGYTFKGGSYITFKEAPKEGDTSKILFYRGTGSVDVTSVDILETIKKGDEVKLYDQSLSLEENKRTVFTINSSDSVNTNLYPGPGITTNESFQRSVMWSRQTADKVIDGETVTKDRPHYEPLIYPNTNIIQSVGVGSTVIFVSNVRTFFDSSKEAYTGQSDIRIVSQENVVGASATAFVSTAGTVSSFDITNPGVGYTIAPTVSITTPVGYTTSQGARATATISGVGTVSAITVSYGGTTTGFAYTHTDAPSVLIGEPKLITYIETIKDVSYSGDFGVISGISTTSVAAATTGIVFDLLLPKESLFRDASIVGSALTVSGISTGYYFTVFNSNVGNAVTSLYQDGSVVGIGTSFLDNVYEVASVSIGQTIGLGIGQTYVAKVTVSVQDYNGLTGLGYSEFFGEYSWGRIATQPRGSARTFTSYAGNSTGIVGINTSPIIERVNPLRYINYNS